MILEKTDHQYHINRVHMVQIHIQVMEMETMVKHREGEVDQENMSLFLIMIYYERLLKEAT